MTQPRRFLCFGAFLLLVPLFPSVSRAGTWVTFQNSYTRGTGSPVAVTNTFTLLNPNTQYTLKAYNGGLQNDTTELVSYSVVYLNGAQVVGPTNFNQSVAEVNVTIFPGFTNTLSVQVRGKPGGVLTIQVIGVDNDPPIIAASLSPAPNAVGWNNSPVTVTFACSDKTSGLASCPAPVTVATEGANKVVSGTATDLAGNTATTTVKINLDMTPPTITGTINPPPDSGGYNSGPVTVMFACSDAWSGVASCSPPVSVSSEGSTPETGTAIDVAGNTASTTITVNMSLSYFKIRSWQTNPAGDPSQTGKCLDYGVSPRGNGASVFLNDCSAAHPVRVVEYPATDQQGNLRPHAVILYAGSFVIGIQNAPVNTQGGPPPAPTQPEYSLELQHFNPVLATTLNQIFALDGDSVILESSRPCINTVSTTPPFCPDPPPQLVIQVQKARGTNGSPLVAAARNFADSEFWDFVPLPGSRPYPTTGFTSMIAPPGASASSATPITTNWQLWNAICAPAAATSTSPPAGPCSPSVGWGSVIVVAGSDPNECTSRPDVGPCLDFSGYAPIQIPAGVTVRGNRRGTSFGAQLFANYRGQSEIFRVEGDYARVTGLRLHGQDHLTDSPPNKTNAIWIDYVGKETCPGGPCPGGPPPQIPLFPLATVTELIATIDHNDMSDWWDAAITADSPFNVSAKNSTKCTYNSYVDTMSNPQNFYQCDPASMQTVPYSPSLVSLNPNLSPVTVANDPGTLPNIRVARNFLHHNERNGGGYGVGMNNAGGRVLIDANTFSWNRHDITGSGEPHSEYRALSNLVLSGAPTYNSNPISILGRLQDFDMHGTDNIDFCVIPLGGVGCTGLYFGGAGGYYVEIAGNTFLGGDGHDYALRGFPILNTSYHDNVSRRKENDAIKFIHCNPINTSGCINDYTDSPFPIDISNSVFGQTSSSPPDPMSTLGVGDFDGDGDDDLFAATGAAWYYSPAGQREWRFLNSARDTIDQLLLGDFDGDGRTDVVGLRNGNLVVSWGGISAFEPLNSTVPPNCTMANMTVGDFSGVGRKTDIFCFDGMNWWISYGGNNQFMQGVSSKIPFQDLRFGHFAICGAGIETDVFSVQSSGWNVSCGATGGWQPLPVSLTTNPASVDGLVVADFDGNGIADIGMPCNSGGVFGVGASPGWQISYGGAQGWSTCNAFAGPLNAINCSLSLSPCITLANGAIGRFSGGPGADILLWSYYNSEGAAPLLDMPGGTGTAYTLSSQDMH